MFQLFTTKQIDLENTGNKAFGKSLNSDYLKNDVKIPLPPFNVQQQIVDECIAIDKEVEKAELEILRVSKEIGNTINSISKLTKQKKIKDVIDINLFTKDPTQDANKEFIYIDIESVEKGTGIINYTQKLIGANVPSRARRLAPSGSSIISTVRPYLKGFAFIENEVSDAIYSTGFAVIQSKDLKTLMSKLIYYLFMYSDTLMKQMEVAMPKGSYPSINKTDIENFTISIPPIAEQESLVTLIEALETKIAGNQTIINNASSKKQEIIKKYL